MKTTYRGDIDGLRALAVLLVIGFHAFPDWIKGGFIGVDVFFVISGFLISSIIFEGLETGTFSFGDFYVRRVKRIFPALAVVLVACLIVGWFLLLPADYRTLGKDTAAGAGFISNFRLLRDAGYFDTSAGENPLLHLWSLGVEEQFYIVWPLIVVTAWRWRYAPLGVACAILAISFLWNVALTGTNALAAFYLPVTRFWELMLGCILAFTTSASRRRASFENDRWLRLRQVYQRYRNAIHEAAAWLGIALIVLGAALINPDRSFPGWWALMPAAGAAFLVFAGQTTSINRLLGHPWLVFIGLISYPLYLWHWPILVYARIALLSEPTALMKLAAIIAAFILAYLTYKFVERPIRFGARTRLKPVATSAALATIGCVGLLIYAYSGIPQRFPSAAQVLFKNFSGESVIAYREGTCFVDHFQAFTSECDGITAKNLPKIVLWGDSHAAHLFPGLNQLQQKEGAFQLAQFTSSGCPPIFSYANERRKNCRSINDFVGGKIESLRPETVVLAGRWELYQGSSSWGLVDAEAIRATVARLKSMGVKRVVAIGQFPLWQDTVPRILARTYLTLGAAVSAAEQLPPQRNDSYLKQPVIGLNEKLRQVFSEAGAIFISPPASLCNDQGCLLLVPDGRGEPLVWDNGHLTKAGSAYFIELNSKAFIGR